MTVTAKEFRETLERVGLSQSRLAALLGSATSTVNRWGSERPDRLDVPAYAVAFLRAYEIMTPQQRERLTALLGNPNDAERLHLLTRIEQVNWDALDTRTLDAVLKAARTKQRR